MKNRVSRYFSRHDGCNEITLSLQREMGLIQFTLNISSIENTVMHFWIHNFNNGKRGVSYLKLGNILSIELCYAFMKFDLGKTSGDELFMHLWNSKCNGNPKFRGEGHLGFNFSGKPNNKIGYLSNYMRLTKNITGVLFCLRNKSPHSVDNLQCRSMIIFNLHKYKDLLPVN